MGAGKLSIDPLFMGLTRPAMLFGVSYSFVIMNGFSCLAYFIMTSQLMALFVMLPLGHLVGYMICFKEPLFIELFVVRQSKCRRCSNRFFHGANSYDPYYIKR